VDLLQIVGAIAVETLGAMVQGSVGFGINLVAAPLLEIVDPAFLPGPLILAGLLSGLLVARRERGAVQWARLSWAIVGRVPGTVLGVAAVVAASRNSLRVLVATAVILAVISSVAGLEVVISGRSLFVAGVVSGIMGTIAGLGGTPMGLLYQGEPGRSARASLSRFTVAGSILSLTALAASGRMRLAQVGPSLVLVPGVLLGYAVSSLVRAVLDGSRLRPAILFLAGVSALGVIVQAVT
jgi:uncharacterized membrane protein YfcA